MKQGVSVCTLLQCVNISVAKTEFLFVFPFAGLLLLSFQSPVQ